MPHSGTFWKDGLSDIKITFYFCISGPESLSVTFLLCINGSSQNWVAYSAYLPVVVSLCKSPVLLSSRYMCLKHPCAFLPCRGPQQVLPPGSRSTAECQPIHWTGWSHGEMPQHFEMEPCQVAEWKKPYIHFPRSRAYCLVSCYAAA